MRKPKSFRGALGKPIAVSLIQAKLARFGRQMSDEEAKAANDAAMDQASLEALSKLPLLMAHYGIDPDPSRDHDQMRFLRLAFAMATEFVPGFRIESATHARRGRKREWHVFRYFQLLVDFEQARLANEATRKTLQRLIFEEPYRTSWGTATSAKARTNEARQHEVRVLEARLSEARREVGKFPEIRDVILRDSQLRDTLREFVQSLATRSL